MGRRTRGREGKKSAGFFQEGYENEPVKFGAGKREGKEERFGGPGPTVKTSVYDIRKGKDPQTAFGNDWAQGSPKVTSLYKIRRGREN